MRNKEINLLVKPTHECDLLCEYCYDRIEKSNVKNKIITDALIKEIAIKSCRAFENINWIWHGGEPTIAGIDFYKKNVKVINEIAKKYNTNIKFSMQSNGKNISSNEKLLIELNELGINVSISLDFINENIYRSTKEEFDNILRRIKYNKLSIINVINQRDFPNLINNYKKLAKENINFMFNKRFNGNENKEQLRDMIKHYKKYIDFIIWENNSIDDRSLKDLISSIVLSDNLLCNLDNCIKKFISINPDGDIFPCDRYGKYNSEKYSFINISNIEFSLLEYLSSDILKHLYSDNNLFIKNNCRKCDVYTFCNGGCKANRISNGIIDLTVKNENDCIFLKEIISYIFNIIFNLKKEDYLKLNEEVYKLLFDNNFVTKEVINRLEEK